MATLRFDNFPVVISADLTPETLGSSPLGAGQMVRMTGSAERHELPPHPIAGTPVKATLTFLQGKLDSIEMLAVGDDYGTSWGDWSEEKELKRKADTERAINHALNNAVPWHRVHHEADSPATAQFEDFKFTSVYDAKAGSSYVHIQIERPGPREYLDLIK